MKKEVVSLAVAAVLIAQPLYVYADSSDQMMQMLEGMKQQMSKMQDTINQQSMRIQQLESRTVLETPQPNVEMQPSGATMSDADFQKSLKDNIGEVIPWLKGAKYSGDLRLRMENFKYYNMGNDAGTTDTDMTRNRFRIRLRWGFEKDYGDDWKAGFRIVTATNSNAAASAGFAVDNTSTNTTLGNPGYYVYKNIYIDRAFAQYSPNGLKDYGLIKGVSIGAGKFENPFLRYATTIVWDGDVTPEGAYEKATLQLMSTEETKVNFYATMGQFIVNENTVSGTVIKESDAEMYGYQGALNISTYALGTEMPVDFTAALSYYDYRDWRTTVAANSTGASFLRTNSLTAEYFKVLDFYPEVQFYVDKTPVTLWYDYARNLGNVGTDAPAVALVGNLVVDEDDAWGVGGKAGKIKKKGDWETSYGYFEIGANAVPAAFNDSDFGGPGGNGFTNRKGHKLGVSYALTDAVTVNWTGYLVRPLNPTTVVANSQNESVFRSQADLVFKF